MNAPVIAPAGGKPVRIGEVLVNDGLLTEEQLADALAYQRRWSVRLGDVLLAKGLVRPFDFYRALSKNFEKPFVNLMKEPPESQLLELDMLDLYSSLLFLPWKESASRRMTVATANPAPEALDFIRARYGPDTDIVITSKLDIVWTLQREFAEEYGRLAVFRLDTARPDQSARKVITTTQVVFFYALFSLFIFGLVWSPLGTAIVVNGFMALFYLGNFMLKIILAWAGGDAHEVDNKVTAEEVAALKDDDLPVFTVLVPMYKEPQILPILTAAIRRLDYPLAKLDVKLVLEQDDHETIEAAKSLGLEGIFEIIAVPPSKPQTKPKACNYALSFARGDYVVIYDAEDKPEPDQLKKVVAAFRKSPENVVCIQCRLNYYNADENWLTRMFTLDYSLWFDLMLPGLERLGIPIPLGGTSNHFKTSALRSVNAWDPFNVTEDADLGVRLTQHGYHTAVVNSTTFEEANVHIGNWIRQRSRWIKGYMQTYLVHMRDPIALYRSIGATGFWGFQFFIGGTMLAGILNPIFWSLFVFWLLIRFDFLGPIFPEPLLTLSLFSLLAGNLSLTFLALLAPVKRGWMELIPWGMTIIAYWGLLSVAAWKALWQLIANPFYWEKTTHGLSASTAHELAEAAKSRPG